MSYIPLALLHKLTVDNYYNNIHLYWSSFMTNFKSYKIKRLAFTIWKLDNYFKIMLNELISQF